MSNISLSYHLIIPTIISILILITLLNNKKRLLKTRKRFWVNSFVFITIYLLIVGTSTILDIYAQYNVYSYDLNKDGFFNGNEITLEQREAVDYLINDLSRNFSFITGIVFSTIITLFFFLIGKVFNQNRYYLKQRKQLIVWLFKNSQKGYVRLFKQNKKAWNISKEELLKLSNNTFGYHYGTFLEKHQFEVLSKLERHDAYHVITNYKTNEQDEIALQYLCFGNGKQSVYLFCVISIGIIILPDYYNYYFKSYQLGKNVNTFYNLDFENLLETNIYDLQKIIFTQEQLLLIQN